MAEGKTKIVPLVDDKFLQEIKHRIVKAVPAEKIIIFGSFAYGKPTSESDLDILVVMDSDLPRHKRSIPIYRALAGLFIQKDVVVYTPAEIKEWEDVPQAFVTTAIKKGRVIYEKKQA